LRGAVVPAGSRSGKVGPGVFPKQSYRDSVRYAAGSFEYSLEQEKQGRQNKTE
jgi:hypothetical protein